MSNYQLGIIDDVAMKNIRTAEKLIAQSKQHSMPRREESLVDELRRTGFYKKYPNLKEDNYEQ